MVTSSGGGPTKSTGADIRARGAVRHDPMGAKHLGLGTPHVLKPPTEEMYQNNKETDYTSFAADWNCDLNDLDRNFEGIRLVGS